MTFHQSGLDERNARNVKVNDWDASGSIRKPTGHLKKYDWVSFDNAITVPTRSLDSWAEERGIDRVDFIWADVQGAECDLIRGGTRTLAKTRYFYTEYDNETLFEGQWMLDDIVKNMPRHRLMKRWYRDALFALETEPA